MDDVVDLYHLLKYCIKKRNFQGWRGGAALNAPEDGDMGGNGGNGTIRAEKGTFFGNIC